MAVFKRFFYSLSYVFFSYEFYPVFIKSQTVFIIFAFFAFLYFLLFFPEYFIALQIYPIYISSFFIFLQFF